MINKLGDFYHLEHKVHLVNYCGGKCQSGTIRLQPTNSVKNITKYINIIRVQ